MKKTFWNLPLVGCVVFLFLVTACGSTNQALLTGTPTSMQTKTTAPTTITSTVSQTGFAATVGSSGYPVEPDAKGDNLTTIHSAVDRPVAKFTLTVLNVPPRAKGVVYIQNDSANDQTLVSDTPNGFAPFTIANYTTTSLVFRRIGTFKAHLKGYPMSVDTTITIIITMPNLD